MVPDQSRDATLVPVWNVILAVCAPTDANTPADDGISASVPDAPDQFSRPVTSVTAEKFPLCVGGIVTVTSVEVSAAVGSIVMFNPIITAFPTRAHVLKRPLLADVLETSATVGVYVPLQKYWFVVPVTAPALLCAEVA